MAIFILTLNKFIVIIIIQARSGFHSQVLWLTMHIPSDVISPWWLRPLYQCYVTRTL